MAVSRSSAPTPARSAAAQPPSSASSARWRRRDRLSLQPHHHPRIQSAEYRVRASALDRVRGALGHRGVRGSAEWTLRARRGIAGPHSGPYGPDATSLVRTADPTGPTRHRWSAQRTLRARRVRCADRSTRHPNGGSRPAIPLPATPRGPRPQTHRVQRDPRAGRPKRRGRSDHRLIFVESKPAGPSLLSALEQTRLRVSRTTDAQKKSLFGQFLTPARTAHFMAGLFRPTAADRCRLLDPRTRRPAGRGHRVGIDR